MGSALSAKKRAALAWNKQIEERLLEDGIQDGKEVKLLFLGTDPFLDEFLACLQKEKDVEWRFGHSSEYHFNDSADHIPANVDCTEKQDCIPTEHSGTEPFLDEILAALSLFWNDSGVDECFGRSVNKYQPKDSVEIVPAEIDPQEEDDSIPTDHSIVTTTGLVEVLFYYKHWNFKLIDVSNQRGEWRKWIRYFEDVTAIIFCAAMSEYDEVTQCEDETTNRMQESLKLFDTICNSEWFTDTHIILFLTQMDLFEERIKTSPLTICFPEYTGTQDFGEAAIYIREQFEAKNKSTSREIYCEWTRATNSRYINLLGDYADGIRIANNLKNCGLY